MEPNEIESIWNRYRIDIDTESIWNRCGTDIEYTMHRIYLHETSILETIKPVTQIKFSTDFGFS